MLEGGLIGISNNHTPGALIPKLIRFFTSSQYTHTFLTLPPLFGVDVVIEAGQLVQVVPFETHYKHDVNQSYILFRPNPFLVSTEDIKTALKYCFHEFAGYQYGYIQLVWFVYRWFMLKVFKRDIRFQKNFFTDGIICSELVYYFLYHLGEPYRQTLENFSADTIQAQDILEIVQNNPQLFEAITTDGESYGGSASS